MLLKILCPCLCLLYISLTVAVQADTVHYYRFEAGPGFLVDSTGNADLSTGTESEWVLPGSAGRGSHFPKGFGPVDPEQNKGAAAFAGVNAATPTAPLQPLLDTFTVELFAHFDTLTGAFGTFLVADALTRNNSDVAWLLNVRRGGFDGSQNDELQLILCTPTTCVGVNSGYVLETGTDYYIAAVYDGPNNAVTFWLNNLDSTEGLQSNTIEQALPVFNTIGVLTITAISGSGPLNGIIDELRISDTLLGASELLINNTNSDVDEDNVSNDADNCIFVANAGQRDTNGDNIGNVCDADLNSDCIVNTLDLGLFRTRFFSTDPDADFDGDGVVNPVDLGVLKAAFFAAPGPSGVPSDCDAP